MLNLFSDAQLKKWLNPTYLNSKLLQKLAKECHHNHPFPHLVLPDFMQEDKADQILLALSGEEFSQKQADLFQFKQTSDLISTKNPILQEFRSLLISDSFISLISVLSSCILQPKIIDLSASLYENKDFLLCHDDLLEGRKVAFFYYLSNLQPGEGGALSLFSSSRGQPDKVDCQILPKFNNFAFFIVSKKSFHQVEEMLLEKKRYALSGWFHQK